MEVVKIKNKGQAQLFYNRRLELFTKSNPFIIWGMYLLIITALLYYAVIAIKLEWTMITLLFITGSFSWTLFEYLIHRFLFHFVTENKIGKRIIYIFHANHHEYPRDKTRLFMPPLPSLLVAAFFFFSMYFIAWMFGNRYYAIPFFSGFIFYYLVYASMHYAIHTIKPPFKWMKALWRNHHLHHYKEEQKGFGVSTTLWDRVFGTMYKSQYYSKYSKMKIVESTNN